MELFIVAAALDLVLPPPNASSRTPSEFFERYVLQKSLWISSLLASKMVDRQ